MLFSMVALATCNCLKLNEIRLNNVEKYAPQLH